MTTTALGRVPGTGRRTTADRYRLERGLGQGGMATVHLAEELRHDRQVAIKVLRPDLAAVLGAEPFVEGGTLRAKLDRETQLGIEEAVRIAVNVAMPRTCPQVA